MIFLIALPESRYLRTVTGERFKFQTRHDKGSRRLAPPFATGVGEKCGSRRVGAEKTSANLRGFESSLRSTWTAGDSCSRKDHRLSKNHIFRHRLSSNHKSTEHSCLPRQLRTNTLKSTRNWPKMELKCTTEEATRKKTRKWTENVHKNDAVGNDSVIPPFRN